MNGTEKNEVRLTQFSHGAGCGCKIAPADLEKILASSLIPIPDANLLVGYQSRDDAAVYAIGDGRAVVSTTDFFSPIVDDAFDFGRIAATNALSDIYAMGGKPLLAVAILGWPLEKLGAELAAQVVEGGRQACRDAGIPLAGGHSIDAPEPFFGLAVTGEVQIEHIKRNDTARAGDVLLLTKPLGIGVLSTAQKRGKLHEEHKHIGRDLMLKPNSIGTVLGTMEGVHALTDVTGFGLLGHLMEMCLGSDLSARLQYADIPLISESVDYVKGGCYADGALRNWKSVAAHVEGANSMERMMLLCDPQTSGGLLIACDPALLPQLEELFTSAGEQFKCIGKLHGDTNNKRIIVG